jgi:uncharacterized protein with HEPN domain
MTQSVQLALLAKHVSLADRASRWLRRSFLQCEKVAIGDAITDDDFDKLEVLASRFARLSDILVQKLFRMIDTLQLEAVGSTIDIINRAEKRGLCAPHKMRLIRELRNKIAHEYADSDLMALYSVIRTLTPDLLDSYSQTIDFVTAKFLSGKTN